MKIFNGLETVAGLLFVFTLYLATGGDAMAQRAPEPERRGESANAETTSEWRTWTSREGAEIDAYLKDVRPEGVVIVRRDGQKFVSPIRRFSEADRAYVVEWLQRKVPSVSKFRQLDFNEVELSDQYRIENVENVRPTSREPREAAALQTVLRFHGIEFGSDLADALATRKPVADEVLPARDVVNVLSNLPVEAEVISLRRGAENSWQTGLRAIQTAISWNLPVILAYRPYIEPETPEEPVVAIGYDRRNLHILEPVGGRRSIRLDLRDLEDQFIYAMILFPQVDAAEVLGGVEPEENGDPSSEFLSRVSSAIREVPLYEPGALTDFLQESGLRATMRDVNRSDLRGQLGQTRSFARTGGLPLVDAALEGGHVVILPLDMDGGTGFALIYGQAENAFRGVEFAPDRSFRRAAMARAEIAGKWLTRENRTYRLDLIEIEPPTAGRSIPPPPPRGRPPADEPPPSRPPR